MNLLKKGHPMTIYPLKNNAEGRKYQAQLIEIDTDVLRLFTGEQLNLEGNSRLFIEFQLKKDDLVFETMVIGELPDCTLIVQKPITIRKKKPRTTKRLRYNMPLEYTIWGKRGKFRSVMVNISESGMRMEATQLLRKGTILTLSFQIRESSLIVRTQGLVVWCRKSEDDAGLYRIGVKFTTISRDTSKKLADFIGNYNKNKIKHFRNKVEGQGD